MLSRFSCVQLFATLWTVARQAPLSVGFSRHEYRSGFPCPPPGDLPHPGIKLSSLTSPALTGGFFTTSATWKAHNLCIKMYNKKVITWGTKIPHAAEHLRSNTVKINKYI